VSRWRGEAHGVFSDPTILTLTNFGVNLTRLAPGAVSALRHAHSRQEEFVYVYRVYRSTQGFTPMKAERGSHLACASRSP
jgi:hypothetical protein